MADLQTGRGDPSDERPGRDERVATPLKVFISYRRDDTEEAAVRLYERLAPRLGDENVYLDVKAHRAGTAFLARIKGEGAKGSAFLALIVRRWLTRLEQ